MNNDLIARRDLDFQLYEVHNASDLTSHPRYSDHSRETFDAVIDTATRAVIDTLTVGSNPYGATVSGDRLFVENGIRYCNSYSERSLPDVPDPPTDADVENLERVRSTESVDETVRKLYQEVLPALDKTRRKIRITETPRAADCLDPVRNGCHRVGLLLTDGLAGNQQQDRKSVV